MVHLVDDPSVVLEAENTRMMIIVNMNYSKVKRLRGWGWRVKGERYILIDRCLHEMTQIRVFFHYKTKYFEKRNLI